MYRSAPNVPLGGAYPAQFAGVPQFVVPVGQVPYRSTITNVTEYLPVTISMYAAAGCDYVLWDIAAALEVSQRKWAAADSAQKSGALSAVATGKTGYAVGQ